MVFINVSNHPSDKWGAKQVKKAKRYGRIIDIPFPHINPRMSDDEFNLIIDQYFKDILNHNPDVVMVQGEFVFTYRIVNKLKKFNIKTIASCSERRTIEYTNEDGHTERKSEFEFVDFKEY